MRHKLLAAVLLFAALPLCAAEPTPRQRELIEQLLTLMEMDKTANVLVDTIFAQLQSQMLEQAQARGNDEEMAEMEALFEDFRARAAKVDFASLMHESLVQIYAKYFTEPELVDLVTFYSTPTGRKTLGVMNDLMRDGMQMGAEKLGPKIDEVMKETLAARVPKRKAVADLRSVATALEVYRVENGRYPAGDYASLEETLNMDEFPEKDGWGHAYTYEVSKDRRTFRLVSGGADPSADDDIVVEP